MGSWFSFQPAPADYPNHLAVSEPERLRLPPARWTLLLLVLLCLAPRAAMALRIPSVCPDGVLYIRAAEALETGRLQACFREMSLNPYPVVLLLLRHTGLSWEWAAALWGITVSSLVVLPLWGWVRRQFDDRVALVACVLYAIHPKFIAWSPEVMRDPTFWLLFTLSIYWLWRAVTEVRYGYFLAAGAVGTLALLTRIEGLFLLIPLTLWTFWRFSSLRTDRGRLLRGATLCVTAFPALLLLVYLGWMYDHSGWTALRLNPLARAGSWFGYVTGSTTAADGIPGPDDPISVGRMLWVFFPTMTRGLSPIYALLMFGGLWGWRRVWGRRDHQPLFYATLITLGGIWVQLWYDHSICPRYALPIVLMASPWAALGLLGLTARTVRVAERLSWPCRAGAIFATIVLVAVAGNLAEAMTSGAKYFETRRTAVDLGQWVLREFHGRPALIGPVGITPIVSYYANGSPYRVFRWEADDDAILSLLGKNRSCVVLLRPTKQLTPQRCKALTDRLRRDGLQLVEERSLPATRDDLIVLVRKPPKTSQETAQKPSARW